MNLFIFFALPLATILLSIVFQKILRSPILVAITFFAIYLIVAFTIFSDTLAEALIAVIIYTIIAYITAYLVMLICRLKHRFCHCSREKSENQRRCSCENNNENTENNLLRISCSCGNSDRSSDLLTVDSTCLSNNTSNENNETETITSTDIVANNQYVNSNYGKRRCYRRI